MSRPIYLDYNATTPIAPEVLEAMIPALRDVWGNPSSAHVYGHEARAAVERARERVAALIGARPDEIIFTGGGTESDNAAIVGVAEALRDRGMHIVISAVEHAAVGRSCDYLATRGWEVARVPVDGQGRLDPAALRASLRDDTTLISVMHANNETGVLLPVTEIADVARERGIVFHCDAAQTVGKLPVHVDELGVDLLTIAGHKLYGPKGVGALYLRRGTPCAALLRGAGHESGRRSGTESVPSIVGLGAACELASSELPGRSEHLRRIRDRLQSRLRRRFPDMIVHGGEAARLPNTLYVALPGVEAAALLARLDGVATAAGAACHGGKNEPSAVLRAMGVTEQIARCTLRLTVGGPTTEEEVDRATDLIAAAAG